MKAEISEYVFPPLATLNVPAYEMVAEVGRHIERRECGRDATRRIELNVEYIERSKTKPPS